MFGLIVTTKKKRMERDMAFFLKGLKSGRELTLRTLDRLNKSNIVESQVEEILKEKEE